MGKCTRKAKTTGDVAVMELSQSTLGVRTRSKTLALQRVQSSITTAAEVGDSKPDYCYLQLRSRRLEKPLAMAEPKKQARRVELSGKESGPGALNCCEKETGSRVLSSGSVGSGPVTRPDEVGRVEVENRVVGGTDNGLNLGFEIEPSCGEKYLDFEPRERSTRECTPCGLTRDLDANSTPGSPTRRPSSDAANQRPRNDIPGDVPSTQELDEFFAQFEQQQQQEQLLFMEKYNFDIVNDIPLQGHYGWVKLNQ